MLIDRLLNSPEFARHMANSLDVMLMERRAGTEVPAADWQKYLFDSMLANKPLNELAREILSADGVDPAKRPAAKFYLDRAGETNLITRDVGRVFFGKDFQCAQCHDHPLIDDYFQADYYGIFAFLNRSYVFKEKPSKDKKDKKAGMGYFAEKADGDVNFNSVFTKKAGRTGPRLPDEFPFEEPTMKRGEEYVVAPAADVMPVPKYSRRAQLAMLATNGSSRAFNRNMANRLWAQMLGRGIVEPVDLHHSDNPPSHPELLEFLTDQIVAMKFDAKAFLREILLSQTYQRSYELPSDTMSTASAATEKLPAMEEELARVKDGRRGRAKKAADRNFENVGRCRKRVAAGPGKVDEGQWRSDGGSSRGG